MANMMEFLTTSPLPLRLALPADGDDITAKLKATLAVKCAAELSIRFRRSRALIRALIRR